MPNPNGRSTGVTLASIHTISSISSVVDNFAPPLALLGGLAYPLVDKG